MKTTTDEIMALTRGSSMDIPVDSNVILGIRTEDQRWFPRSSATLATHAEQNSLVINPHSATVGFIHFFHPFLHS